jgi:hypothetical protein
VLRERYAAADPRAQSPQHAAGHADALIEQLQVLRAGKLEQTSADLGQLVGRPAASFADWARRNAAAFR